MNRKSHLLTMIVVFVVLISSCSKSKTTSEPASNNSNGSSRVDKTHGPKLYVFSGDSDDDEITFDVVTPQLIEKKIREQDWNVSDDSENTPPTVSIQRKGERISCWVYGSLSSTEPDEQLQLSCNGGGGGNFSAKINSVDEAVKVLVSYFNDDDQWLDLVKWNSRPIKGY